MPNLSAIAQMAVSKAAETRQRYGVPIVVNDKTYLVITRALQRKEQDLLPEGSVNAAVSDLRVFNVSPADFPVLPVPGSRISWTGLDYTVIFAVLGDPIGGTYASVRIFAYRSPAAPSATEATDAEQRAEDASAGSPDAPGAVVALKRKTYSPSPSGL